MRGGRAAIRLVLMSGAPVHQVAAREWNDQSPFARFVYSRGGHHCGRASTTMIYKAESIKLRQINTHG